MSISNRFSKADHLLITNAIRAAERNTSGEIRVHIESRNKADVLDRAAYIFDKLKMQKTELRNGVLFYLALDDHKFAIIGDIGINQKVPENFWEEVKENAIAYFKEDKIPEGLEAGILKAGEQLKKYFPYQKDDVNELNDDISFGND